MRDSADKKTVDAFGTRRRGRPSTGKAMTEAEKKRAQRERARAIIWETAGIPDYTQVPTAMLVEAVSQSVARGSPHILKACAKELVQRAQANSLD